uniref:Serine/threonine-protein phosphatase 6 regulatory ankyrin repeat subunit A (Trinotate prediction) n=1 Tax=Myxobolus squamalis TaxID=59785 RepID=A0A6B2FZC0_MYXSQ
MMMVDFKYSILEISPFHMAASRGEMYCFYKFNRKILNILLQYFENINFCTQEKLYGYTPVHLAASISNIDCLKALLEHSLTPQDLNIKTKDNLTALSISVLNKSSEALIRYLVKKGSHLNIPFSSHLISLIHVACIRGNSSILEFFLKSAADSNQITENRKSGALLCAQVGSLLCLKVLHKYEADFNLLDADMYSPLQWACIKGNNDIVDFLLQNIFPEEVFHGSIFSSLHCAVFNQSIHSVNAILEMKREIPQLFDIYLRTPLHYAVALDEPSIVESLLNSGASLSIKNSLGETPIHIAAVNHNRSILDVCLAHSCDLSIVDHNGNTALHLACLGGHKENAALLTTKMTQEEISIKNNQGEIAEYFSQKIRPVSDDCDS